ncbi:hypothetical protein SAMN05216312_102171 [Cohnella sp. OV330]|uniref:hypothetical protein n=1 Tax=Cohnella sp. OV330 TaxID=1855288 RepID=UPI0008ECB240|nr:hypothetical protein [Cohnella sp. OV330]SFA90828.1 hypothetical protein SAMN05216312_102171 [Cohnella sp. OV330]
MTELAYEFFVQYDGCGDKVQRFEAWLLPRVPSASVMRAEVSELRAVLDELAVTAP